ncbi:MAG: hypothetical protein A2Z99_01765 [Treponema sp. GWB1_62_6]|nr:MAG: hypothetical protein A2Z99_01765 [Treponema sp. GWB1_62_6]OHE68076.1 MAG: hypothetical protein A2001_05385 [Treponema sp. GWC1_61_84]
MPDRAVLEFRNLSFRYPAADGWALEDLSFALRKGELIAVIGGNGAGKSSLCKCANGIIPHSEGGFLKGRVFTAGLDTRAHPVSVLAREAGLVLEDPDAQLFATTVLNEAAFGPENLGLEPAVIRVIAAELLSAVGLAGLDARPPSTLSGGQKQRLAVAAALAMKAGILVLDEPTSRLDGEGSEALMDLLGELKKCRGLAILMATHDLDLVRRHADRVLVLEKGKILALDTPERVLAAESRRAPSFPFRETAGEFIVAADQRGARDVLEMENATSVYPGGIAALRNVGFKAGAGEFIGIVGRNGSGKTTLLKCLTGLVEPFPGKVLIKGRDLADLSPPELAARVAYVQQNPDLQLFSDTVRKEAAFGPVNLGFGREETDRRVRRALGLVGLSGKAEEHPLGLDRTDRALTALASAIAMESAVLLLDEPTCGQDHAGAIRIMEIIRALRNEGRTVLVVGHDLRLLARYADRLLVMDGGAIVADGAAGDLLSRKDMLQDAGLRVPHDLDGRGADGNAPSTRKETICV